MIASASILLALLRQPVCALDRAEPPEARRELARPVAEAIADTAHSLEEAAALISVATHESHLCRYVLTGHCADGPVGARCDHGRARGPFQVHGHCREAWRYADGSPESFRAGAACVLRGLRYGVQRHGSWEAGFTALTGSGSCCWSGAAPRLATMRAVLRGWGRA